MKPLKKLKSIESFSNEDALPKGIRPWLGLIGWQEILHKWSKLNSLGQFPQVLMIEGRSGLGKKGGASAAAALSFCHQGTACGECPACRHILTGREPDIFWVAPIKGKILTAAAAELTEFLNLSAGSGDSSIGSSDDVGKQSVHQDQGRNQRGLRIAVIAEADRLTVAAANKLLKILEEPPAGCRIILTSSRPNTVLATIRSRVVSWKVRPPSVLETLEFIKRYYARRQIEAKLPVADKSSESSRSGSSRAHQAGAGSEPPREPPIEPPIKPPFQTLVERGAYTPGGAVKALENWLAGSLEVAMMEKIVKGRSDLDRLEACEPLVKARTVGPAEMVDMWEVALVKLRRQFVTVAYTSARTDEVQPASTGSDLLRQHQARQQRRELRRLAGRHQIVLNGQLQLENLALTR